MWEAPAYPALQTIIVTALGLHPLLCHKQWWIKAHVPYNNTKLSTYSLFIQPVHVLGVDFIIRQFGYFPQITPLVYLIPYQPSRGFIGFLGLLVLCILTPERGCRLQDVAISRTGWALGFTSHPHIGCYASYPKPGFSPYYLRCGSQADPGAT